MPANRSVKTHLLIKFSEPFFDTNVGPRPKFGTHVRIETRLALTNKLTHPTPGGLWGYLLCGDDADDVCGSMILFVDDVCGCQLCLTYILGPVTMST